MAAMATDMSKFLTEQSFTTIVVTGETGKDAWTKIGNLLPQYLS